MSVEMIYTCDRCKKTGEKDKPEILFIAMHRILSSNGTCYNFCYNCNSEFEQLVKRFTEGNIT